MLWYYYYNNASWILTTESLTCKFLSSAVPIPGSGQIVDAYFRICLLQNPTIAVENITLYIYITYVQYKMVLLYIHLHIRLHICRHSRYTRVLWKECIIVKYIYLKLKDALTFVGSLWNTCFKCRFIYYRCYQSGKTYSNNPPTTPYKLI